MSVSHAVSLEEYLRTTYRPDCDWVDGKLRERNLGLFDHARLQVLLAMALGSREKQWNVIVLTEQRLRVNARRYRIPDLLVLPHDYDRSPVVSVPPLLCMEILSPDDTMREIVERCEDYLNMGVPEVWIFDPYKKKSYVKGANGLHEAPLDGTLRCGAIEVSLPEVFGQL
jgi:Uma2 family endonuclease